MSLQALMMEITFRLAFRTGFLSKVKFVCSILRESTDVDKARNDVS